MVESEVITISFALTPLSFKTEETAFPTPIAKLNLVVKDFELAITSTPFFIKTASV